MGFDVAGEAYDRYMGRYSRLLSPLLADLAGVRAGMRVLDVGCGPGALTGHLVDLLGAGNVAAADPSAPFVTACAARFPDADVRRAAAAELPWPDDGFDAALAQLVVNFLPDPVAGVAEMRRVVRPGGVVAACTWDYGAGMRMLRQFWDAAVALDPAAPDEAGTMPCTTGPELAAAWRDAGLLDVRTTALQVSTDYADFDELWAGFELGVGPAGAHVVGLDPAGRAALRAELRRRVGAPDGPFRLGARAWAVSGRVAHAGEPAHVD